MSRSLMVAVAVALVVVLGCQDQDRFSDLDRNAVAVEDRLDGLDTRLDGIDRSLASMELKLESLADDVGNNDLMVLDQRLASLDASLDGMSRRLNNMERASVGGNIPTWIPDTTKSAAEDALSRCMESRLSTILGAFGASMAPNFVDLMDLDGMLASMEEDAELLFGEDTETFPIWFMGTLMGCWTGPLQNGSGP